MASDGNRWKADPDDPTLCLRCGERHVTAHGHPSCRAHKRSGEPCRQAPVDGATTCRMHFGKVPQVQKAHKRRMALEEVKAELDSLGGSVDVEPSEAVLVMVREAAWNVVWLRRQIEGLRADMGDDPPVVIDEDGVAQVHPSWVGSGVAGRIDPSNWKSEPHVMVKMYNDERDRLVRYSKLAHDMGIEERYLRVYEQQGQWLVNTLDAVFEQLGLTAQQQDQLPAIMGRIVEQLEQGEDT